MPITSMQNIHAKRQNNYTEKILFCLHYLMGSDVSISSSYADIGIWWDRDGLTRYLSRTLRTLGSPQSSVQCPELRVIQTPAYHQHGKIFIQEYKGEMFAFSWDSQSKGRLKSVFRKVKGWLTITILSIFRYPHSQCTQYIITSQGVTISSLDTYHLIFLSPLPYFHHPFPDRFCKC